MSIKIENIQTMGWEGALRGMRNPLNSWDKADSAYASNIECTDINLAAYGNKLERYDFVIGQNDLALCLKLIKAGSEHRKFLRMIHVQMDITAPLYWWKEFGDEVLEDIVDHMNFWRDKYLASPSDKRIWWQMIQLLPSSYNQRRTIDMSMETVLNILHQRSHHRLDEWIELCDTMLKQIPYCQEFYNAMKGEQE